MGYFKWLFINCCHRPNTESKHSPKQSAKRKAKQYECSGASGCELYMFDYATGRVDNFEQQHNTLQHELARHKIVSIESYKCKLSRFQLTQFIFYHEFIVLQVGKWFYSVERNMQGITVQRSREKQHVLGTVVKGNWRVGDLRAEARFGVCATGKARHLAHRAARYNSVSMQDILNWLLCARQHDKYHVFRNNCQHFVAQTLAWCQTRTGNAASFCKNATLQSTHFLACSLDNLCY